MQSGVIKDNHTPGIKEGRNHKKVSSFFILKKNTDCWSFKAPSFQSKVFGEKWGGRRGKTFSKVTKYGKIGVDFVISDEKVQFKSKALLEVMSCSQDYDFQCEITSIFYIPFFFI